MKAGQIFDPPSLLLANIITNIIKREKQLFLHHSL